LRNQGLHCLAEKAKSIPSIPRPLGPSRMFKAWGFCEESHVPFTAGRRGGGATMTTMSIKGIATLQDLLNTPRDGRKYELVDGEIVVSPAGMRHSEVASNINGLIWEFLQRHPIGKVYSSDVASRCPTATCARPM